MAECKFLGPDGQNIGQGTRVQQGIEGTERELHIDFAAPSFPTPSGRRQCLARDAASMKLDPAGGGTIVGNCQGCGLGVIANNRPRIRP